jgi:hypothetical protein
MKREMVITGALVFIILSVIIFGAFNYEKTK